MDTFPDLGALSDQELKDLIHQLTEDEQGVSYKRRIVHGKIDILRAELVNRPRKKHEEGESVLSGADVQQLTDILAGKESPTRTSSNPAVHCPECGFVNAEGANYRQKCGAFWPRPPAKARATPPRPTRWTRPASSSRSTSRR